MLLMEGHPSDKVQQKCSQGKSFDRGKNHRKMINHSSYAKGRGLLTNYAKLCYKLDEESLLGDEEYKMRQNEIRNGPTLASQNGNKEGLNAPIELHSERSTIRQNLNKTEESSISHCKNKYQTKGHNMMGKDRDKIEVSDIANHDSSSQDGNKNVPSVENNGYTAQIAERQVSHRNSPLTSNDSGSPNGNKNVPSVEINGYATQIAERRVSNRNSPITSNDSGTLDGNKNVPSAKTNGYLAQIAERRVFPRNNSIPSYDSSSQDENKNVPSAVTNGYVAQITERQVFHRNNSIIRYNSSSQDGNKKLPSAETNDYVTRIAEKKVFHRNNSITSYDPNLQDGNKNVPSAETNGYVTQIAERQVFHRNNPITSYEPNLEDGNKNVPSAETNGYVAPIADRQVFHRNRPGTVSRHSNVCYNDPHIIMRYGSHNTQKIDQNKVIPKEPTRGPRFKRVNNPVNLTEEKNELFPLIRRDKYNLPDFETNYELAMFFVIKSFTESDVYKSIKYNVWASTSFGNVKLDTAYHDANTYASEKGIHCPIFLFFSVNASGQFVGVAEMIGQMDYSKTMEFWEEDIWKGFFPVKWHIIKDIESKHFQDIILENNDNLPVTRSKDTQEVKLKQGLKMLDIFKKFPAKTSLLDDCQFYENQRKSHKSQQMNQRTGLSHMEMCSDFNFMDVNSNSGSTEYETTLAATPSTVTQVQGISIDSCLSKKGTRRYIW